MKYQITSFSEGKKGGQITVTVSEGANRRSFTRHLKRQNGAWVGLNIDERAIPLNERYEQELTEAKREFASAEAVLKALLRKREALIEATEDGPVASERERAITLATAPEIEAAEDKVAEATEAVDDAEAKLDIVRRELPLMMEFRRF